MRPLTSDSPLPHFLCVCFYLNLRLPVPALSSLTCFCFVPRPLCPAPSVSCSHLPASAGWTGVSALSNGGVMEPTAQGLNGSLLASQPGLGTAGYPTH